MITGIEKTDLSLARGSSAQSLADSLYHAGKRSRSVSAAREAEEVDFVAVTIGVHEPRVSILDKLSEVPIRKRAAVLLTRCGPRPEG